MRRDQITRAAELLHSLDTLSVWIKKAGMLNQRRIPRAFELAHHPSLSLFVDYFGDDGLKIDRLIFAEGLRLMHRLCLDALREAGVELDPSAADDPP